MKLTVFNGSPRGENSNTKILLHQFLTGFTQNPGNTFQEYYLIHTREHANYAKVFEDSEAILLAFPLYADAMPGLVMAFIEELRPPEKVPETGAPKKLLFLVQSGFPEAIHLAAVEKYLLKLARRLRCESPGAIIKGGVEGIQIMPPKMTRKLFGQFFMLGETFGRTGVLDGELLKKIRGMERIPPWFLPLLYLMRAFGLMDYYWNTTLKANNAFERRFDRPY